MGIKTMKSIIFHQTKNMFVDIVKLPQKTSRSTPSGDWTAFFLPKCNQRVHKNSEYAARLKKLKGASQLYKGFMSSIQDMLHSPYVK